MTEKWDYSSISEQGLSLAFNELDVTAGTTSDASLWIKLDRACSAHSFNAKWSGIGILRIYYEIANWYDSDLLEEQGDIISGALASQKSGFLHTMSIKPSLWIRFYAEEEDGVAGISDLTGYFLQTGRGA